MPSTVLVALIAVVMVIGVVGTVLPLVPGLWLIWAAGLVYGVVEGFGPAAWAMALLTLLAIAGTAAAAVLPQRAAAGIDVPVWGQLVATGVAVIGFFVVPVVGAAIGFVLGILVVVLVRTRDRSRVVPTTVAIVRSMVVASAAQLATGIVMVATWIAWVAFV